MSSDCFNEIFPLKTKVTLHNLNAVQYNGKHGVIVSCLNKNNPERFGVRIDGYPGTKAIKPSHLMTAKGVSPVFVYTMNGIQIPCKARLFLNVPTNEIGVAVFYSDHMGLDALKPALQRFFGAGDVKDIVGEMFGRLSTALVEYRTKPKEVAIAMYKNADLAKCMEKNGLIKFTQKTVKQGYGTFAIAKICFQQMFNHDVLNYY